MAKTSLAVRQANQILRSRSKKRRSKTKMTIPLGVVLGFAPGLMDAFNPSRMKAFGWSPSNGDSVSSVLLGDFLGIQTYGARTTYRNMNNGSWFSTWRMGYGLFPLLAGVGIHILANKIGINRAIGRATRKIPVINWLRI